MSLPYLAKLLQQTRSTFSKSHIVIESASKFDQTNLMFVDIRVKINGTYYCDMILTY